MDNTFQLNAKELNEAKGWISDCLWQDITCPEDIEELSIKEIERGIKRHYAGGIKAFKKACRPLTQNQ